MTEVEVCTRSNVTAIRARLFMAAPVASRLKGIAQRAIADACVAEPPVDLAKLAEALCIPVRMVNLPTFFRGAVVNEDGMPVLVLNVAHTPSSQRRTLGHLLGHVLIVLDGGAYPRASQPDHDEADALAEELMMPADMVSEQAKLWFNDYRYLARMFAVDEGEMLERMRRLGILKSQRGIAWDY